MRVLRRGAMFAAVALATGCAPVAPVADTAQSTSPADAPFAVAGRLSASHGTDALTANFDWHHAADADTIALATPLGQTLAQLSRAGGAVSIALADGRHASAATFEDLTSQAFGVPLPVSGLAAWIRGQPHAGSAFAVERDAAGRADVLRQDGWEIVYTYADDTGAMPRRLTLAYPDVAMRVVVDQWR